MKKYFGLGIGILIAAVLAGVFFLIQNNILFPKPISNTPSNALVLPDGTTVTSEGGGKVEIDAIDGKSVTPPSLTRPITITTSLSAEVAATLRTEMEDTVLQLKENSTRVDLWLRLGSQRKMAGDYEGAREAWDYVAIAGPASINFIAYANLADLYKSYLKDYKKSEDHYLEAIRLKPDFINFYQGLFELYTVYGYKGVMTASQLVDLGLKSNPGNKDLLTLQSQIKNAQ